MSVDNVFTRLPGALPEELFQTLLRRDTVHIERIVSRGHSTPIGQWYDQAWDEWVLLLQGCAVLRYANSDTVITLNAGDYLFIPAHTKHRVDFTQPDRDSVWLAVHVY